MTIKQLIKLEDKASEVWVISPALHYDTENKDFSELVSVNLGQKTKYRYIVPMNKHLEKNLEAYKKMYNLSEEEIKSNFLLLPDTEFSPFISELAIYNGSTDPIACCAPAQEDATDVIQFSKDSSKNLAKSFKAIWKRYKRSKP
jgi:hypothetical protein